MDSSGDPSWLRARRGISLLLNDKNLEAEQLFHEDPQNIHMTAGICYLSFLNALMCFDDVKVSEAIVEIKKIEEQCASQIGWMKSIKNKLFYSQNHNDKPLEQVLEEKIVLADSLVCQSFLTFLRNDFTSYMKGGWTLRKAWKIYQHTYGQLAFLHKKIFGYAASGLSQCDQQIGSGLPNSPTRMNSSSSWSICENGISNSPVSGGSTNCNGSNIYSTPNRNKNRVGNRKFYSYSSKTISDFSSIANNKQVDKKPDDSTEIEEDTFFDAEDKNGEFQSSSSIQSLCDNTSSFRPKSLHSSSSSDVSLNGNTSSMRKSVSLFSSINNFGSAIYESATSLIGFKKDYMENWETIDPEATLRLMSAVCFGYGIFRLCVSLAPPYILRWVNMLGFEGDQTVAVECLNYSRQGTDMRAPLASLALLWYHTIVRPFFSLDSDVMESCIKEASKILREEKEFQNSALFLFFRGRVERIKPNIQGAIEAYERSVANATITDVKLLGLHEVGWCHLLTLDYMQAHKCFLQLRQQSKWSKSFYSYMATINAGADGNFEYALLGKREITKFLDKSNNKAAQIEKYIRNRAENLPESEEKDHVKDEVFWQLYCFEMLYLWNTFPSCSTSDLNTIIEVCTPNADEESLKHEPMTGIGWLIKGAACIALASQTRKNKCCDNNGTTRHTSTHQLLNDAVDAFRKCLKIRSKCVQDIHISAFAQYELALLLLRNEDTRPEGKALLIKSQTQYKDFDFEQRLNVRISGTLTSVQKYEAERRNRKV